LIGGVGDAQGGLVDGGEEDVGEYRCAVGSHDARAWSSGTRILEPSGTTYEAVSEDVGGQ
jgi:hypothetical protein